MQAAIQEVDQVAPGGNYGWPYMEGFVQVKDGAPAQPMGGSFSAPSIAYDLPPIDNGQAVIGGYVYRARRNACLQVRTFCHCHCHRRVLLFTSVSLPAQSCPRSRSQEVNSTNLFSKKIRSMMCAMCLTTS